MRDTNVPCKDAVVHQSAHSGGEGARAGGCHKLHKPALPCDGISSSNILPQALVSGMAGIKQGAPSVFAYIDRCEGQCDNQVSN